MAFVAYLTQRKIAKSPCQAMVLDIAMNRLLETAATFSENGDG